MSFRIPYKFLTLIFTVVFSYPVNLFAAGFQINEHSASGLGRAFAGEGVVGDNAASIVSNASAMMLFSRSTFSFGATLISPDIDINGTSPYMRSLKADNIAPNEVIPNAHYVQPINEKWAIGLSFFSNYGLSTEYNSHYSAGSLGGTTRLMTGNINPNIAYRLNEHVSLGAGFNAIYARAKLIRHLGEIRDKVPALSPLPSSTEITALRGDTWSYGWNAAMMYEINDAHRFSLAYRSKVDLDFTGHFRSALPIAAGGTNNQEIPAKLSIALPDIWEFSAYHRLNDLWALHYGVTYTGWHSFKQLSAQNNAGQVLFEKSENFKDSFRIALGGTYYYSPKWSFRTGIAYDQSAAPNHNRSISIPDQDRYWLSGGTNYQFTENASIDVGLTYMQSKRAHFTEKDKFDQFYDFKSKGSAVLYAMNFNYQF